MFALLGCTSEVKIASFISHMVSMQIFLAKLNLPDILDSLGGHSLTFAGPHKIYKFSAS